MFQMPRILNCNGTKTVGRRGGLLAAWSLSDFRKDRHQTGFAMFFLIIPSKSLLCRFERVEVRGGGVCCSIGYNN